MKKTVTGIAAFVISGLLCINGVGLAVASTAAPDLAATDISVSQSAAQQVQQANDQLQAAVNANSVSGVQAALTQLSSILDRLRNPIMRSQLRPESNNYVNQAQDQSTELRQRLAQQSGPTARADGPLSILSSLTGLLSSLLSTLQNLVSSLLGGLPGGGSTPSTPATPALPAAPALPTAPV